MTDINTFLPLADRGLLLFPIEAGAKFPPLVPFTRAATRDAEKLKELWKRWPNANAGVHAEGMIVLDVDTHKGGLDTLLGLVMDNGPLPDTFEITTPSGGMHYYFDYEPGVANSVQRLGPGLDVRSTGGYVVAPGSETDKGEYRISRDLEVAAAPRWLVELCGRARDRAASEAPAPEGVDIEAAVERAREWLARQEPAVEGQGGDAYTYTIVCRVRDFGVPEHQAIETLETWNESCQPPWDVADLVAKVSNAYRYAQNPPATLAVETLFDVVAEAKAPETPLDAEMYTPHDVLLGSVLRTDYLVKGWLDRQAQGMVFGHWGSGKTFITLHMAAHIAAGQSWFGNKLRQGGVLFLGYEGEASMKKRLYALRQEFPEWDLTRFMVKPMRWPLVRKNMTNKTAGMVHAEGALETFKTLTGEYPAVIVIDPLRNALGGSDSDPDLTAPYLNYLQHLTKKTGCATLTIHHPGHGDAERGRGDSGIEAHMDTVIKVDGELGKIEARKQRDDPKGAMFYRLKIVELGVDQDGDPRTTCVAEQVMENPLDPNLTDQQRATIDTLRDLAGEEGLVTKTMFRQATRNASTAGRADILRALENKQYLVPEGNQWRLGAGAAEMFT